MFLQPMKKEDISPMTLMSMWNQVRNAATQGVQGGFAKVGETIQKTPLLKLGVNVLNAADYGLGTVAKTTEGLLTDRVNTLKNLKYQRGEGLKSYAQRNVSDITPYVSEKVAGTQMGQRMPLLAPMLGLGAGMISPSPSDFLKVGKVATQAGDVAKFSDEATDLVKPSMLDPLASEAKKYKSAEDFVKAQPKLYHGTDSKTLENIKSKGFKSGSEGYVSLTDDPKIAQQFAEGRAKAMGGNPVVVEVDPKSTNITRNFDPNDLESIRTQEREFIVKPEDAKNLKIFDKSQLTDIWNKANQSNDLISEARKYKSAEEFVEAQGETLYRGVGGDDGGGNYFTNNKEFSRQFTKNYQDSEIIERIIPDNEIYKSKEIPFAGDESQMNKAIQEAKLNGKKAILVDEGTGWGEQVYSVFAFDKSAIKTKSQLTDIWNKAQEK